MADGDPAMKESAVYEKDVVRSGDGAGIKLVYPRQRVPKKVPNLMDVVRRAVASMKKDPNISAMLIDITFTSFKMRHRVYTIAQSRAPLTRKVIVTLEVGRF